MALQEEIKQILNSNKQLLNGDNYLQFETSIELLSDTNYFDTIKWLDGVQLGADDKVYAWVSSKQSENIVSIPLDVFSDNVLNVVKSILQNFIDNNVPIKEYEYFGRKIVETKTRFIGYVKDKSGETIEVEGLTLDEVKVNIDETIHKIERDDVIDRLMAFADTDRVHAERVFKLIKHFHSCEGAAVMNINDYLNERNYI